MKKIILASGSPRRKELLNQIGLEFQVVPSTFEEDMGLEMNPNDLAKHLSCEKAKEVADRFSHSIIIAADTFVVLDHALLGKPHTIEKAQEMLEMISGKKVTVITGFTIIDSDSKKIVTRSVETDIYMQDLTKEEIDRYVATGEPLDKAGAFGIQGRGALLIKEIKGDYFNIVGLPLFSLAESLKDFDIYII